MSEQSFFRFRIFFTLVVTIAIASLLAWNYTNGGVPAHHIFANKDMPEISNWWGLLVLPLLTWFLTYRVGKRIFNDYPKNRPTQTTRALVGFIGALLFGILVAGSFSLGYRDATGNILLIVFPLALFIPIYRSEYLLGFVIGMTYTFGAVLPTGIGSILIMALAVIYLYIRSFFLFIGSKFSTR